MRSFAPALAVIVSTALLSGCKRPPTPEPPATSPEPTPEPKAPVPEPEYSLEDIARLRDPDVKLRLETVLKLSKATTLPPEAVEPLIAMFGDEAMLTALRERR